ncbi:thioredoxin-like fold protein [Staphylotrichum tortipilum]|uniref:Thioredoxin-like fold protein n=1 Tax=Staphylotrichum tortipilum TaxID=2831512 RepID=A0AAN6MBQ1_9PEZI|nr:thioredoxin-like fold protein [Staphylotrichum longicolle]
MASSDPTPQTPAGITFYDIGHRPPVEASCSAPNPWKARLALNFKALPYTTTWVRMPDIGAVRKALGAPATRQFADGSDFPTLPVLVDGATSTTVGDSFDIALYLQRTYPTSGGGDLFPPQTLDYSYTPPWAFPAPLSERADGGFPEYLRFNISVDAAFSTHTPLMVQGLPFDPATEEETRREFVRRAGLASWDDFRLEGEARGKVLASFEEMLGGLGGLFGRVGPGPFLMGEKPSYADFIVGGWLRMAVVTLPAEEWEMVRTCHGGTFGRLHDALEVYAEVK